MSEALPLYTAAAVRELDRRAIAGGSSGFALMQRAAAAAFAQLRQRWPRLRHCLVCGGGGNNGGDGLLVATLAQQAGLDTRIVLAADPAGLQGAARQAFEQACAAGVPLQTAAPPPDFAAFSRGDSVIVDALLGTGLTAAVRPACRRLIDLINASGLPVLALDLPSGLDSDDGSVHGAAVRADVTVTFIGRKLGLYRGMGPALAGQVCCDTLGLPAALLREVPPVAWN